MTHALKDKLSAAYAAWNGSLGKAPQLLFELMAEDIQLRTIIANSFPDDPMGRGFSGRAGVLEYYAMIAERWEMVSAETETLLADGNRMVWIGTACWRSRKTLQEMPSPKVDIWTFNDDGLATELVEMYDSYAYAAMAGLLPVRSNPGGA